MLIDVKRATLLVVDVQDKLLPAIDQHEALQESLLRLVGAAVDAGLPVVFSEQYPQGLGGTTPALLALAPEAPVVEKPETDSKKALTNPGISPAKIKASAPAREMESHVRNVITMPSLARSRIFFGF